ncbi:MAG: hypothetical protein KOO61_01995 [Spirochaetales bacterium]|nr:hypothetical protein [Spirochaetales bacterium]
MRLPGTTRLAWRFLTANRWRNITLGATVAVAVFGAVLFEAVGRTIVDQLEDDAQRRYGTAQITLPGGAAGTLAGEAGWITRDDARRISDILRVESVSVYPRVQSDAVLISEGQFTTVRVISSADAADDPPSPTDDPPSPAQTLLVGYGPATLGDDAASGFMDLDEFGVSWVRDQDVPDLVWVSDDELMRALREVGVASEDAVGNVLLIGPGDSKNPGAGRDSPDDRAPAVVAYNSAEILIAEFPQVVVRSRQDLADRAAKISAENIPLLLSLVLILPAIAAIVGSVLVTGESRGDQLILLRTMGFDTPTIRALVVREVFMVATGATFIALVLVGIVAGAVPNLAVAAKSIVRFSVIGVFIPPGLSFLTARRLLSGGIHERLAEFRR